MPYVTLGALEQQAAGAAGKRPPAATCAARETWRRTGSPAARTIVTRGA